jgi:hypothetical protein
LLVAILAAYARTLLRIFLNLRIPRLHLKLLLPSLPKPKPKTPLRLSLREGFFDREIGLAEDLAGLGIEWVPRDPLLLLVHLEPLDLFLQLSVLFLDGLSYHLGYHFLVRLELLCTRCANIHLVLVITVLFLLVFVGLVVV